MKPLSIKCILLIMCILSSCAKTDENNTNEQVDDIDHVKSLLSSPHAIANPKNDDEYFFNYRLVNFAPSTEPFIKETFGDALMFEEAGFWKHSSYTSHVVGFTTSLPAISIVEYGETTDYGHVTIQSESYYYQHLHYIKGLESGKTYHFRFIAQDNDGITIISGDHTFTTKELTADIIRIPEDMEGDPPYVLTRGDAKYVITRDLSVPTMAINIKANNVEIDLDGHTVTYDNVPAKVAGSGIYDEEATFGIRAGLWNFENAKILNGFIKQGINGGSGVMGQGHNPIFLNHMGNQSYNEIAGITVDYYGGSIDGMTTGNGHVHHNVLYDRGTVIDDRHAAVRAMATRTQISNPNNIFAFNSLRRFRHWGIGNTSGRVEHNELYSDSFATNSFSISGGDNVEIKNNRIFGMGYLVIGIGWGSDLYVKNNFIYLRGFSPSQRSEEYSRSSSVAGMRVTDGNVKNLLYENNVIVLKPENGCTLARGIWGFNAVNNENIVYRHNTVKVEAMPGNLKNPEDGPKHSNYYNGDVNNAITAVTFSERAENLDGPIASPIIFEDNHLIGNVNLVVIGEGYGICNSVWMYRTKMEKIEHNSEFFRPVRLGFWYWNTFNNQMIDTDWTNISEQEQVPFFFGGTGKMEMQYGESKTLTAKDSNGGTLANKRITLTVSDDGHTQTVQTDGSGKLTFDLLTVRHFKFGNSQEHDGVSGIPERTDYRQYVFNIEGYKPITLSLTQLRSAETVTFSNS